MSARTQTLLQLTDELVALLDRRASAQGISRSALVRDLLEEALEVDRSADVSRRMIDAYREAPQQDARDAWGDLDAWSETNARRNLAALGAEEAQSW